MAKTAKASKAKPVKVKETTVAEGLFAIAVAVDHIASALEAGRWPEVEVTAQPPTPTQPAVEPAAPPTPEAGQ